MNRPDQANGSSAQNVAADPSSENLARIERSGLTLLTRTPWHVEWIDNIADAKELADVLRGEKIVTLDFETVGWQHKDANGLRHKEAICLNQWGIPSQGITFVYDVYAVTGGNRELERVAFEPLKEVFTGRGPIIINHDAKHERERLLRSDIILGTVHDTFAIAKAVFPEMYKGFGQLALAQKLSRMTFDKGPQGGADWSIRPLPESDQHYAELDPYVEYEMVYKPLVELALAKGIDLENPPKPKRQRRPQQRRRR